VYVVSKPVIWTPKADQGKKYEPVIVPAGFVTSLDIVPRRFWGLLRSDSDDAVPTIRVEFLYWDQTRSREVADDIFRTALEESGVFSKKFQQNRLDGQT
jgi:hypothetical protein